MYFVVQIIFEGVAGTGFYGSDVAIDDILVSVKATVNCTLILPTTANPTPPGTPTKSKSSKCKLQPVTVLLSSQNN